MGTDMWAVVGRTRAKPSNSPYKTPPTALSLFNQLELSVDQFEFENYDPKALLRNYDLYSLLSGERGNLKPLVDVAALKTATQAFIDWVNEQIDLPWMMPGDHDLIGDVWCPYHVGDYGRVLYPVELLQNFDYDAPALRTDECTGDVYEDPAGESYRERISSSSTHAGMASTGYFELLEFCATHKWEFVIFGFSD